MQLDAGQAARLSSERLTEVLDAVVAVGSDLHLNAVLQRIVESACRLAGARYGALGVLTPSGDRLSAFFTHGISPEERRRLGPPPVGHGVLGLLIRDPRPLRLADVASHPGADGMPEGHPPIHSFLGAPFRVRGTVFGNLYLGEKQGGPGERAQFTAEDEQVVVALAAAAGVAIDNARLYERSQDQHRLAAAATDITRALLHGDADGGSVGLMAKRAAGLVEAEAVMVVLAGDDGRLRVRGVSEDGLASLVGSELTESAAALALSYATPGALVAQLPIGIGGEPLGLLVASWRAGEQERAESATPVLEEFARQSALALQAERWRRDRNRLALLEDRERIARDMHDNVIQRLFATGLSLQAAERSADLGGVRARIDEAVDELDASIKDIRHSIFALRQPDDEDLAETLTGALGQAATTLGFAPALTLGSDVSLVEPEVAVDVVAVVREGLANVARHSRARHAWVDVSLGAGAVRVEIADDGVGLPQTPARSGLANLARRAERHTGSCEVGPRPGGGTLLVWTAPATASASAGSGW